MESIPITILAGSDHTPGPLPESAAGLHALAVYKGAEVMVGDKTIIELLVEQIKECEGFGPISIAGPASVYRPLGLDARIVDTNGTVSTNLHAAIDDHLDQHGHKPVAMLAYDVILSSDELDELRQQYERDQPCAMWLPFVRMPQDKSALGPFAWKPSYRIRPEKHDDPISILPGHLAIFQAKALRLPLLYKLLDLAYHTRNHSVAMRRRVMVRSILANLLWQDLRLLSSFQLPRLTASVMVNGLRLANGLRKGGLTIAKLEKIISGMFVRHNSKLSGPKEGIRHPVTDILSLAEDIDTEEEAVEFFQSTEGI